MTADSHSVSHSGPVGRSVLSLRSRKNLVGVAGTVASLLPTRGLFVPKHDGPSQ
jgi:hypothetical protein